MEEDSIGEGRLYFPFLVRVQEPKTEVILCQLSDGGGVEDGITKKVLRDDDLIIVETSQLVCPSYHFYNLNLDSFQSFKSYVFFEHTASL